MGSSTGKPDMYNEARCEEQPSATLREEAGVAAEFIFALLNFGNFLLFARPKEEVLRDIAIIILHYVHPDAALKAENEELRRDIGVTREKLQEGAAFEEWAQAYLDSGRWAGHRRDDAVKTELLERDALVVELRAALQEQEAFRRSVAEALNSGDGAYRP